MELINHVQHYSKRTASHIADGRTVNTSLANSTAFLNVGDLVRIKYIPGQEDYPVLG